MHALRVHVLLACTGLALGLSYNFEIDSECPTPSFFWNTRRPLRPELPFKSSVLPHNAPGWHMEAGADSIDAVQSQDILYNEAYEWTKHVPIHHWKYTDLAANVTKYEELTATRGVRRALNTDPYEQLKCVAVSYTGAVQIPNALDTYLDIGHFEAHVHKTVCASPHPYTATLPWATSRSSAVSTWCVCNTSEPTQTPLLSQSVNQSTICRGCYCGLTLRA